MFLTKRILTLTLTITLTLTLSASYEGLRVDGQIVFFRSACRKSSNAGATAELIHVWNLIDIISSISGLLQLVLFVVVILSICDRLSRPCDKTSRPCDKIQPTREPCSAFKDVRHVLQGVRSFCRGSLSLPQEFGPGGRGRLIVVEQSSCDRFNAVPGYRSSATVSFG